jgi:hypothetical protein
MGPVRPPVFIDLAFHHSFSIIRKRGPFDPRFFMVLHPFEWVDTISGSLGKNWLRGPADPGQRVFHSAFGALTRPRVIKSLRWQGRRCNRRATCRRGLLPNQFNYFGPVSRHGVPLENPLAGICRPCQIWGSPTQKGEASFPFDYRKDKPLKFKHPYSPAGTSHLFGSGVFDPNPSPRRALCPRLP